MGDVTTRSPRAVCRRCALRHRVAIVCDVNCILACYADGTECVCYVCVVRVRN